MNVFVNILYEMYQETNYTQQKNIQIISISHYLNDVSVLLKV